MNWDQYNSFSLFDSMCKAESQERFQSFESFLLCWPKLMDKLLLLLFYGSFFHFQIKIASKIGFRNILMKTVQCYIHPDKDYLHKQVINHLFFKKVTYHSHLDSRKLSHMPLKLIVKSMLWPAGSLQCQEQKVYLHILGFQEIQIRKLDFA